MIDRMLALTADSTELEEVAALNWYEDANDLAVRMTHWGNVTFEQACVGVAAFSIRQSWERNQYNALLWAEDPSQDVPALGVSNRIAANALIYDDPFTALNGDKTHSFALNIAGDLEAVTIDVHMLRALGVDPKKTPTHKQYREYAQAVRDASYLDASQMFPAQYQALVWIKQRGSAS